MQNNSFNTFSKSNDLLGDAPENENGLEDHTSNLVPSSSAMVQPFWLKPGYISGDHCLSASKKLEKRKGSDVDDDSQSNCDLSQTNDDTESTEVPDSTNSSGKKVSRSGPLTREEIATEAACMLYRKFTPLLNRCRAASRVQLFHDVMYIFTNWSLHNASVDQRTLQVAWEQPLRKQRPQTASLFPGTASTQRHMPQKQRS